MCRWLDYCAAVIPCEDLLFKPERNVSTQSMSSRSMETPTAQGSYLCIRDAEVAVQPFPPEA